MALVQYNPSTGLASYNYGTGKQQAISPIGEDCVWCDTTPLRIRVTLAGIIAISNGCKNCATNDVSIDGNIAMNGSYVLTQHPINPCFWEYRDYSFPTMTTQRWSSTDGSCTNAYRPPVTSRYQFINVRLSGTTLTVWASYGDVTRTQFRSSSTVESENCVEIQNEPNTITSADGCFYDYPAPIPYNVGYGGTATVEAIL